jgi:segregation and condensation protein B
LIYSTSKSFMDYFGINSPNDLPKISEVLMEELVKATVVNADGTISNDEEPVSDEFVYSVESSALAASPDAEKSSDDSNPSTPNE